MVANNLLNLYTLVLVPLFSEWMYEWELCHLDSAVVNCMLREKFLDVLTRCSVANLNVRNECYYSKFEWIALRKLSVRNIDVWKHKVQSSVDASVLLRTKRLESVSDVSINKHELFRLIQLCPVIHSLTLSQASYSMLRAIVDKIQCLQSLYIEYVSDIPEGASLHFGPHLTSITMHCVDGSTLLRDNPGLTSVGLLTQYAPSQVGRLHRLDLKSCYPDNEPPLIEWNHPYDLQSLFLSNINISDDYLIQLAHRCPALTCLVASASSSITDTGLVELAKCCPSLTRLDIGSTLIADHSLLVLASSCTRLKQLNVSKAKEVTDLGVMAVVRDCTQLSQLRIKQSSHSRRFKNILTMRPSLTYLEAYSLTSLLSTVHNMEYLHVTLYSVKMSSLWMRSERISLVSLKRFEEPQLCSVVQRCPGLLELSIDEYLDESVLIAALMHCPLLTALRLAHSVSDISVRAIAASGVRLKRIEIHKSALDDSVLTPFVASQPELRKLALIRCSSYTDDTLYAVAQHCSRLASVELIYNREVTDGGVIHLLRGCSLLRSLNVSLCSLITVNVLNVIAELGRDMTLVDVSCTRVLKESSKFFLSKIGKVVGYVD